MRRWVPAVLTCAVLLAATPSAAGAADAVGAGGGIPTAVAAGDDDVRPAPDVRAGADDQVLTTALAQVPAQLSEAPPVLGAHAVRVRVGRIGSQATDGVTAAEVAAEVTGEVTAYWSDSTGGALSFFVPNQGTLTTYGSWGSLSTCTDAQIIGFLNHAEQSIAVPSGIFGPGEHAVVYTPEVAACDFSAISYLGDGGVVWINGSGTGAGPRWVTIAHELGHTLTLGDSHSRVWCAATAVRPTAADGTSAQCIDGYQGDAYDVMGFRTDGLPGPLNAVHLDTLGLLSDASTEWVDGTQTVVLQPVGGLTGKRFVAFETNLARYYVEFRSPVGRDADLATGRYGCPYGAYDCQNQAAFTGGLVVHRADAQGIGTESFLLDAPAGDPEYDWENGDWWTLPAGYTFTTANGVVSIDLLDHTVDGAQVRVSMPSIPIDQIVMTRDVTGDGKADVFTVDGAGTLYLFPGTGNGRLGAMRRFGPGWGAMRVFAPGDWSSDGRSDLVAADAAGYLWMYPGNGAGGLGGRVKIGNGWNGYRIVPAGDMNGDGRADLLAIDPAGRLWLYPGAGLGKFGRRVQVGNGWTGFELYAAGDANRDGWMDILSIDAAGKLWYYAGRGGGFFWMRQRVGHGWSGYEFASGADLNRDGYSDLLGRDPSGALWFYPGRHGGTFGAKATIANGW